MQKPRRKVIDNSKSTSNGSLTFIDPLRRIRGFLNAKNEARRVIKTETSGRPVFGVPSEHYAGVVYDAFVDEDGVWKCIGCPDFSATQRPCKHIFEVLDRFFPDAAPPVDPHMLHDITRRHRGEEWYADARRLPHKPFPYTEGLAESTRRDRALEQEEVEAERLILDLAKVLNRRHPYDGTGCPGLPPGDRVAVMLLRSYLGRSMRKARTVLDRLEHDGKIKFAPKRTSLVNYNKDAESENLLAEAFQIATDPFRLVETVGIIDATGESPFYVANWRLSNHGEDNFQNQTEWLKLHWILGRESKAPLAFRVTPGRGEGSSDIANAEPLIRSLKERNFDALEFIVGDNIYLTKALWDFCKSQNLVLVTPTKGRNFNIEGLPKGAAAAMMKFIAENPELYDELTRGRNSIEGLFNTYKRKNPHVAEIGTKKERKVRKAALEAARKADAKEQHADLADTAAATSLYQSRVNNFYVKTIVQVICRTIAQQQLRNQQISYSEGTLFRRERETNDAA